MDDEHARELAGVSSWRVYVHIAARLRERLATGDPPPGSRLASEAQLCREYGVTRNTVRRALATLEADGLVETVPGRGRVVCSPDGPGGVVPRYRSIAADLRAEIVTGRLSAGDPLPSEADLMTRYRVARGTARQALGELESGGLVDVVPGKGRYVRERL